MLRIFVSSTSADLKKVRKRLIDEINTSFNGVEMEEFTPDGVDSHINCIQE